MKNKTIRFILPHYKRFNGMLCDKDFPTPYKEFMLLSPQNYESKVFAYVSHINNKDSSKVIHTITNVELPEDKKGFDNVINQLTKDFMTKCLQSTILPYYTDNTYMIDKYLFCRHISTRPKNFYLSCDRTELAGAWEQYTENFPIIQISIGTHNTNHSCCYGLKNNE